MARYFLNRVLHRLFVSPHDDLRWHLTLPDGRWARDCCVHMLVRFAPDRGHPEKECDWFAVFEAPFAAFFEEVSFERAVRTDRSLVDWAARLSSQSEPLGSSAFQTLRQLLPRGAVLYLVDCAWTENEQLFDVYLDRLAFKLLYLNPLLAEARFFPTVMLDGVLRILVPFARKEVHGARLLSLALATRLHGARMEAPAYAFELTY